MRLGRMRFGKIIALAILGIPLIVLLLVYLAISGLSHDYSTSYDKVKLTNSATTDSVFIKKKVWGVSADHRLIVISQRGDLPFETDHSSNYEFIGSTPFFYKYENDTLTIFVRKGSEKPPLFNSEIAIEQKILSNPEMMKLYQTYHELDLVLFGR